MMHKLNRCGIILALLTPALAWAYPFGPGPGYSGAPGDSTCTACHGGTANSGGGNVSISFGGANTYTPGQVVHVSVTVSDSAQRRWGFEASPRLTSDPQNTGAGTLATVDGNTQLAGTSGTIQWIEHTLAGTRNGTTGGATFNFDWTPPATDAGNVTFYVAANAANGNDSNTGDHIYTATATLSPAASNTKPSISAGNGVVNAASFAPSIAPGAFISIFGTNFSTTTRNWSGNDIVNGKLPTSLDGVSVMVNGKPAAVSYISPTQINAQSPDDSSTGVVNVVVTNAGGSSDPAATTLVLESPALFAFSQQNSRYAAAVATDGSYLGPPGLLGDNVTTRPAHAGEIISLWGNGFGATNPPVPTGELFSGAAPLVGDVTATIGGAPADVQFAGLSGASLYQFNVVVPAGTPAGDQKVVIKINGIQTQDNLFLAVQP
jgi:uncharacterized protein (TIGR03437 family)